MLPEQIDSFEIKATMKSDGSQIDFATSVFVNNEGRVKIVKIYQQPDWGKMIIWDTKNSELSEIELIKLKALLSQENVFGFNDQYQCDRQAINTEECYIDEPFLQSAGLKYIKFSLNGKEKEIYVWTSNGVPESLKNIMKEMVGIKDKLSSLPWVKEISEYDELF